MEQIFSGEWPYQTTTLVLARWCVYVGVQSMMVENWSGLFHIWFSQSTELHAALALIPADQSSMGVKCLLSFLKAIAKRQICHPWRERKLQLMHYAGCSKLWQSVIAIVVMNEGFFLWLVFAHQLTEVLQPASPHFAFAEFCCCELATSIS